MEKKIEAECIATTFEIPMTRTRKIKKNDDQEIKFDELAETYDNWKGLGNNNINEIKSQKSKDQVKKKSNQKKNSLFFEKQNMSKFD